MHLNIYFLLLFEKEFLSYKKINIYLKNRKNGNY